MKKMIGSYYPLCSSTKTKFNKRQCLDGQIIFTDNNIIFIQKLFLIFKISSHAISIPYKDIDHTELFNLNELFPFGVCIFTKDKQEFMFGHINNKKLKNMIDIHLTS